MTGERQASVSGAHAPDWESQSRPSKTNPSAQHSAAETGDTADRLDQRTRWWKRKNSIVDDFIADHAGSHRPVSVVESTTLREDASLGADDGHRSKSWSAVLREFLGWYNDYRWMHLRFRDPDGDLVRAPMLNSHTPAYGDIYYAKLKALERQVLQKFEDPHVVMLTLTGSTKNGAGGPRCPADHLRDVVDPFENNVRPALHRSLDVARWEYAKVIEHHNSGYGHMHVAVFVDGEVSEADFRPAIDAHLKHCDIAHRDAHDYHHPEEDRRPISVNRVDPDVDPNADDVAAVSNLGSYIAEYIGSYGEELFDRSLAELAFRSVCWATGTQRVTFSTGSRELIEAELPDDETADDGPVEPSHFAPGTTAEDIEKAATDPDRSVSKHLQGGPDGWSLDGVGVVDERGESRHDVENVGVSYVQIDGAEHLDPPNPQPPDRPRRRTADTDLNDY